jgi:hypothetical protein
MKNKPSWALWTIWLVAYTAMDMALEYVLHSQLAWNQVPGAVEGAVFGATVTWLFALWRWHKADCGL